MKNLQQGFIKKMVIFLILIFIIGAVSFIIYQNKNESSDLLIYKNEKFGYQLTLPQGWKLPKLANAYIDLTQKYIPDNVNEEIFNYEETAEGVTVKDQERLTKIESRIASEAKTWDPFNANYVIFTNVTEEEQKDFYEKVQRKEKLILMDFFPNRTIRIEPSEHVVQLTTVSTTTPRRIDKTIILSNGIKAQYRKIINPNIGATFVYIPMTSDELTYNGKKVNSLQFTYLKDEISENDFMNIVNSVTFDR